MNKTYFIGYHANCVDGAASAWITYKYLREQATPDTIIAKELNYDFSEEELPEVDEYYFVDFSIPEELFLRIQKAGKTVWIIDHHKTALKRYENYYDTVILDMNECGASLCWKVFFPSKPVPQTILYVKDYDLWEYKFENATRWFNKYIRYALQEGNFMVFDLLSEELVEELKVGQHMQWYHNMVVNSLVKKRSTISIHSMDIPVVNCPGLFAADVGSKLAALSSFGVGITYSIGPKVYYFSVRSNSNGWARKIAESFGGGGHDNAAGFILKEKPEWL